MTDDEEHSMLLHVMVQREPVMPPWGWLLYSLGFTWLILITVGWAVGFITGAPWVAITQGLLGWLALTMSIASIILAFRASYRMRRDREEMARLDLAMHRTYMDLMVQNDRAGYPPLPPPPE